MHAVVCLPDNQISDEGVCAIGENMSNLVDFVIDGTSSMSICPVNGIELVQWIRID